MKVSSNSWRAGGGEISNNAGRLLSAAKLRLTGPFVRKFATLSALTAIGQFSFVAALPILSRMYTPAEFGAFAIYLAAVNLAGPLLSLKFDSALYASSSRQQSAQILALALIALFLMSCSSVFLVWLFRDAIIDGMGSSGDAIVYLLPIGMMLSGAWSISSAWAVRTEAPVTLAIGRLVQPLLMTVLQLGAGAAAPSASILVAAHLVSHCVYTFLIARRELTRADLSVIRAMRPGPLMKLARTNRRFAIFSLPGQVSTLAVSNLPPMVISWFYGAGFAGYYSVAYRLVLAPLTVASMPLGALLIGRLIRTQTAAEATSLVRKVFALNLALVGVPVILLGVLAAPLAGQILGENWRMTGQLVAALSFLGAAQALATPFAEATSVMAAQHLRFLIDGVTAVFVVGSLVACGLRGTDPLNAIRLMSVGGATLSIAGLILVMGKIARFYGSRR